MMIRHVVLYRYRADIPDEVIVGIYKELDEISKRLPGRLAYTWGKYHSDEMNNKGYTHALVADFADSAGQQAFLLDNERLQFSKREVVPRVVNGMEGIVSFDFIWP